MKKILLFLICAFAVAAGNAQFNFTSSDMPGIGDHDTLMYLQYYPITNDLDNETGNNYTWDFSSLPFSTLNLIMIDSFRVKTHIVSASFPNATLEEFVDDGTAGDVNLFSYGHDTLYIHRLGAVVTGAAFIRPLASIAFPISFNSSSVIDANYYHPNQTTILGQRRTTTLYDGFGTLQMPGGKSYANVFRIKKTERDTSYVTNTSLTYTSYIWYKQGGQVPLLRLTYTGAQNLYFVFGSKANGTSAGLGDINDKASFRVYPNPSDGKFEITGLGFTPDRVVVYNMEGKPVLQTQSSYEIDLSDSPKGIYFVNISKDQNTFHKKIVIR